MGLWRLLIVALMPVLKTLLTTGLGLLLALPRFDLLGSTARHHFNRLTFYVFGPSLVASYLASTITLKSLSQLWFMPVNILVTFMIGSVLAWILNRIAGTPQHLRGLVIGCCSAGNLGNLVLIILPEVCKESNSPFGDSFICNTNAKTYTSLSMSIGQIYIWSYVYPIMHACANMHVGETKITETIKSSGDTESLPFSGDEIELSHSVSTSEKDEVKVLGKCIQWVRMLPGKVNLKMVFAPSTIAAIIGFIIGIVLPIRKVMIGDKAPLRVIESSVSMLGSAAVPAMTLIVGANLLKGVSVSLIIGIMGVRYIALPLMGVVIVKAAHHYGLVGPDLLFQFLLMLQYALPPALTVGN